MNNIFITTAKPRTVFRTALQIRRPVNIDEIQLQHADRPMKFKKYND